MHGISSQRPTIVLADHRGQKWYTAPLHADIAIRATTAMANTIMAVIAIRVGEVAATGRLIAAAAHLGTTRDPCAPSRLMEGDTDLVLGFR